MSNALKSSRFSEQDEHWIPLSDLMTGLMMMFLLISIVFMIKVEADSKTIKETNLKMKRIASIYDQMKSRLYIDLKNEFEKDFVKWDAEILPDAAIRFKSPDILFDVGRSEIKPKFKEILDDFFPRYIAILKSEKYKDSIEEVRVEGHTSSLWQNTTSHQYSYFQNLILSQDRARSALQYAMTLPAVSDSVAWLLVRITANGLSYSHPVRGYDQKEDYVRSQRVEFRVRTKAEEKLAEILETAK